MAKPLALIVEDEYDLSFLLAQIVELAGYETEVIQSGDIALDRLSKVVPDLVLLDLNLPKVLGTEILRHIRSEQRLLGIHVIVVTAYKHLAEAVYEQADHVLNKPFEFDQLNQLITKARARVLAG
ncbi:MAG: response regulator [Anaerolineae bacterium]|nr:response regulator [Anaerolineae bacterium]